MQPRKPHDLEIIKIIEDMAEFVVKNGPRYESMARAKHAGDPNFTFLFENDSGPEAVINHDYYQWKKEILQLQSEAASESKSSKLLDSDSDLTRSNLTIEEGLHREEVPGSPSVSDMDMEDDLDVPSPRRDSAKLSSVASAEEPNFSGKARRIKPFRQPDTSEGEVGQLNKGKQAQCRLIGDLTGSLIDNYMSDISEDSEDLEPSKDLGMAECKESSPHGNKEESKSPEHIVLKEDRCEEQSDAGHVESFEKGINMSTFKENGVQESRKRSRSRSRSTSKSRSSSQSRSPRRARSRSRSISRSHEDENKSPSPHRSALHNTLGRSPPKDLSSKDAERGNVELATRLKRGVRGGANICLNYARGRCFRGDSCRLQHQGSEKGLQGGDRALEFKEIESLKLTGSPQNLEGNAALEVGDNSGPSAEVAALKKVKHKDAAEKVESSPEGEIGKRLGLKAETAMMPGVPSHEDNTATRDLSVQANGSTTAPEGKAAAHSDLLQSNISHPSEVGAPSPSSTSRQVNGTYGSPSEAFRYQNLGAVHLSGFSGVSPSSRPHIPIPTNNAYGSTINEPNRTYGNNVPGGPAQLPSSGLGENMGFQHSSHGNPRIAHSTAPSRNSTLEYPDHARKFALSHPSEYGLPFQAQPGTVQNTLVPPPPPVYHPMRQQHDFSTDTTRGYTPLQHGYTSPFLLPAQQHHSLHHPPFPGDLSRLSTFPNVANHDPYGIHPKSSFSLSSQAQSYTSWSTPGSSGISSSKLSEVQSVLGKSSSYSYALTTIPPLPSIIELPGATKPSDPGDQYDPLSDSLEPSVTKSTSYDVLKTVEDGKASAAFASTLASQLENVSPGFDAGKGDPAEAAGDPAVGIVENVSPPEDNQEWSSGQPVEAVDEKQGHISSKNKKNNLRGLKLLRSAVADHVKEVLKPTWKGGHMSKDAFKNIVKKAVDKVVAALPPHHIPKSQEKVDQFMSSSRSKISKLVQGYIDKYQKI